MQRFLQHPSAVGLLVFAVASYIAALLLLMLESLLYSWRPGRAAILLASSGGALLLLTHSVQHMCCHHLVQKLVPAGPGEFVARDGCTPINIPLPPGGAFCCAAVCLLLSTDAVRRLFVRVLAL